MNETVTAVTARSRATRKCTQQIVNVVMCQTDSELWEHRSSREMRKGEEGETDSKQ